MLSASLSVSGSEQKGLSPSTSLLAIQKLLGRAIAIRSLHCSLSGAGIFVVLNEHPCSFWAVIGSSLRGFDKRATGIAIAFDILSSRLMLMPLRGRGGSPLTRL